THIRDLGACNDHTSAFYCRTAGTSCIEVRGSVASPTFTFFLRQGSQAAEARGLLLETRVKPGAGGV
ncbi:hypothetical protein NKR23_g12552, partial [Pleurostoma richardsiae]